jgi:hypothetical protein
MMPPYATEKYHQTPYTEVLAQAAQARPACDVEARHHSPSGRLAGIVDRVRLGLARAPRRSAPRAGLSRAQG